MMGPADVLEIVDCLAAAGVRVWLDGGWAVDAVLGRQTRDHDDLDLVLDLADSETAQRALAAIGFTSTVDEQTAGFIARDSADRRVDVHTVSFDAEGAGFQRLADGSRWRYPPEGFAGIGKVGGRGLACLTAEVQLVCHLGYEPDEQDRRDMRLLAAHCGLTLPAAYA